MARFKANAAAAARTGLGGLFNVRCATSMSSAAFELIHARSCGDLNELHRNRRTVCWFAALAASPASFSLTAVATAAPNVPVKH